MEANMTPINDSMPQPQPQPRFLQQDEDEEDFQPPPPPPPQHFFNPPQMYPVHDKTLDIFTGFDKTAYVIIFVAFILGFFMGKTMQPVILRPT